MIEEVGLDDTGIKSAVAQTEATQSQAKRDIVQREGESFQRFTANSPADIAAMSIRNTNLNSDVIQNSNSENGAVGEKPTDICDKRQSDRVNLAGTNNSNVEHKKESAASSEDTKNSASKNQKPCAVNTSVSSTGNKLSPRDNQAPVTSVQFQADYRRLKADQQAFYQYFKVQTRFIICQDISEFLDFL